MGKQVLPHTVSVGTETQGLLLKPAEINSVAALKTNDGHGQPRLRHSPAANAGCTRPDGRTVMDVAFLLSALTGVDENDFTTSSNTQAGRDYTQFLTPESLAGVRVGLPVWNDQAFE